jgi:TRAP-type C4-dicarboxylate transport system permease small subunit
MPRPQALTGTEPPTSAPPATNLDVHRAVDLLFKGVEALMAALLVGMVAMVLGNVILRYGFETGISSSEELSRTFFVWLTFIGAVVATRDGTHLGVDGFIRRLPRRGQLAVVFLSELVILTCCVLLFKGTWMQHEVNATAASLITGMPLIWVYGIGYVTSVGIGALVLHKMWRIVTGQGHTEGHPRRRPRQRRRGSPVTVTIFLGSLLGAMALGMPIAFALLVCGWP